MSTSADKDNKKVNNKGASKDNEVKEGTGYSILNERADADKPDEKDNQQHEEYAEKHSDTKDES